jgi:cyclomaltodextrinase / maltogenic alpha-amylase / neopullulanase
MNTPDWVKDAVFYQIFPDRFAKSARVPKPSNLETWDSPPTIFGYKGGDLLGVAEKLDYLQDLGVMAVYFTPIFTSAANHRYHTMDYYSVDPILGGNTALRELLDKAHKRGIRVVLDGVFNHASRGFYQFNHALENGAASPYLDWFHFDMKRLQAGRPLNAYPDHAGSAHRSSLEALGYKAWWDLPALPKLNTSTPAVRAFIMDVARYWIRFGIDGWRLDVPGEIDDDSFWQEFRSVVKAENPDAYIVGEIWEDARRWLSGDQFDAVMNYLFTKPVISYFADTLDLTETRKAGGFRALKPMDQKEFTKAIDTLLGMYAEEVTLAQLNLLDSHDTPRLLTMAKGDESALRLAVIFMFTFPGAPCVYYGDEIGMAGRHDPDCRRAFPWEESAWNRDLREYYKGCIALRKAHPSLRRGGFRLLHSGEDVYAFERSFEGESLAVALNLARQPRDIPPSIAGSGKYREIWSENVPRAAGASSGNTVLSPRSARVFIRQDPV